MTTIMHIDVNSAFLSWQAAYELQMGSAVDLREVPSVVGGSQADRRGIVLAKSIPAKKFGIQTGEVIWQAKQKCPELLVVPPNYNLYVKCSNEFFKIVCEYSPKVQRFSVDEVFLDYTGMEKHFGEPVEAANTIKDRIKKELGFTVNIGIGQNKLTAKMASDFKKPDMVHTLYPNEIAKKLWPLPIEDLFMVGRQTKKKLDAINIKTIGDIANTDPKFLRYKLKSAADLLWRYANGIDDTPVRQGYYLQMKGIGNSTTIRFDVEDRYTAAKVLLSLTESVAQRLRFANLCCRVITVLIRSSDLSFYSHQKKLITATNVTDDIYSNVLELFDQCWKGEKVRHLGIRLSDLCSDEFIQTSFFDCTNSDKKQAIDSTIDELRSRFGNFSIMRGTFVDKEFRPMCGGVGACDYPVMSSIL